MQKRDIVKMADDIVKSADAAEVGFNRKLIDNILGIYEKHFSNPLVPVSFRTTTKSPEKRGLDVRYVDVWNAHDPYSIAISNGLISKQDHPVDKLLAEIKANFPVMGYGIDFGVLKGFEKIWPYLPPHMPQTVEKAYAMELLPESVKNNSKFFSKHKLNNISIFGIDYPKKSVNIYFMTRSLGVLTTKMVKDMLSDMEFQLPSQELIEHCAKAVIVYFTYTWDSPKIERVCFGILAPQTNLIPTHFHPIIEKYSSKATVLGSSRKFIYSITLAAKGDYIKIENDYSSQMVDILSAGSKTN